MAKMEDHSDKRPSGRANDRGSVTRIRGSVLDIEFAPGRLPAINEAVVIESDVSLSFVAEVQERLDQRTGARGCNGEHFPSPIHAKFLSPRKLRKALWETAFSGSTHEHSSTRFGEDP
jgi:hypothetical protein